jgi:hypothetical protein
VPAAAVFFIPAPPRLSTAHAVGDSSLPSRVHGQPTLVKPSGFWPNKSAQKWTEEEEDWKTTEKAKIKSSQEKGTSSSEKGMAPMGGNSLRWVPRDKLDRLMAAAGDAFEEFGEASKFPCLGKSLATLSSSPAISSLTFLVDPPEMVLADSAPELGPGLANCFRRVRQCVFHMSRPLERRVGMALGECVLLCVGRVSSPSSPLPPYFSLFLSALFSVSVSDCLPSHFQRAPMPVAGLRPLQRHLRHLRRSQRQQRSREAAASPRL